MKATYAKMKKHLETAMGDLAILAGDKVGPSDATAQDVAGTCIVHLQLLTQQLQSFRDGNHEAGIVFPSPFDVAE